MNDFGIQITFGDFRRPNFANANAAPIPPSGAVTSDAGLALLHRITRG